MLAEVVNNVNMREFLEEKGELLATMDETIFVAINMLLQLMAVIGLALVLSLVIFLFWFHTPLQKSSNVILLGGSMAINNDNNAEPVQTVQDHHVCEP